MSSYSGLIGIDGAVSISHVLRDDGASVLTGRAILGGEEVDTVVSDDGSSAAYQAWLKAGGKLGAAVPLPKTVFAPREFIALFTPAEQSALLTSTSPQVRVFVALALAGSVDVTNAEVIADVGALVQAGLLTQARASAILAGTAAPAGATGATGPTGATGS